MNKIQFFCSDLDGTLLGNPEATRRFKTAWESLPKNARPQLGYASGRFVQDVIDREQRDRRFRVVCRNRHLGGFVELTSYPAANVYL